MKTKNYPKNLTAKEIREEMERVCSEVDDAQDHYFQLRDELLRRGLKE